VPVIESDVPPTSWISEDAFATLRHKRLHEPESIQAALANRPRRPLVDGDGKLFIVAADHPARGALSIGTDQLAMANRYELLRRLALALAHPGVDGVLGTPDIIDDLALLGALDNKIAVGSMNRGGLRGSVFEIDDRYTAYDIDAMHTARLDAGKLLVRIDLEDPSTVRTLEATAHAVTAAARARLPLMLEPFISRRQNGKITNDLSTEAVIKSVAVSCGLGAASAYSWLKLPVVDGMADVMQATTLPTLLLGGEGSADQDATFRKWADALELPGVHGLIVGRNVLYPADGDVTNAIDKAAALVHGS
jgi:DhnA family fructose-bisphosphate aldolase class Ia